MVVTMKTRLLLMRVMMMRTALCWSSAKLTFDSWRVFSAIFTYLLSTSTYPFPPDTTLTHNQYLTICIFQNYSLFPTWMSITPNSKDGQILQKKDCWARYTYIVSYLELYLEGGVLTFFLLPVFQQSTPLFTICSGCLIKISADDECQLCRIVTVVNTKHPVQGPSSLV